MKYYAKQIPPEYQRSPMFDYDFDYDTGLLDHLALFGNRHFGSHMHPHMEEILEILDSGNLAFDLENLENGETERELIESDLAPWDRQEYTDGEITELSCLVQQYQDERDLCPILSIVTGDPWSSGTIRGCCQGDWQNVYYNTEKWSDTAIKNLECEYFNLGTQWEVADGETAPETPEEIEGFMIYTHSANSTEILRELSETLGCDSSEILLYGFNGYRKIAEYIPLVKLPV